MEFGMSRRIKPKEKYVRISMKEIWHNLDGPPKNKELWSDVVSFEFSTPKIALCNCFGFSNFYCLNLRYDVCNAMRVYGLLAECFEGRKYFM